LHYIARHRFKKTKQKQTNKKEWAALGVSKLAINGGIGGYCLPEMLAGDSASERIQTR
jgi:hypothetical protein